jgi:septal ring factor EnvC (AmiA/AmiB activator)
MAITLEEGQDVSVATLEREIEAQRDASDEWGSTLAECEEEQTRLMNLLAENRTRLLEARARVAEHDGNLARLRAAIKILRGAG